jgi:hypothetical protein
MLNFSHVPYIICSCFAKLYITMKGVRGMEEAGNRCSYCNNGAKAAAKNVF